MFETIQPESSSTSHTGKIVAGVIVVVLLAFGVLYFTHLSQEPAPGAASQSATGAPTPAATGDEKPEPLRDLQILKFNLGRDQQTQTMAMWDIQVANRSRAFAYKDIQYATNYYDASNNVLYQNEGTIPEQLAPMDQRTVTQINDGLYPVGTVRYTIEIKGAQAVQP